MCTPETPRETGYAYALRIVAARPASCRIACLSKPGATTRFVEILIDSGADDTAYRKLNPRGRVPPLVIDGRPMFESVAICLHLLETHSDIDLAPVPGNPAPPDFARAQATGGTVVTLEGGPPI
ncbi:MAG: glutathione S-transferase [Rhodospirillales bacterium]|nr:glutathione S-transferase [Rhodospirillales bacterium]